MQATLINAVKRGFAPLNATQTPWALVIGDLMLDCYLWGKVDRVSPEAPVPVVLIDKEDSRPGGAANVAANLTGLGLDSRVLGCIGRDPAGETLLKGIANAGVDARHTVVLPQRPTITKTRVIGGHQQMLRLDRETITAFGTDEIQKLSDAIQLALKDHPTIVVLSDYAKGVLHPEVCQFVIAEAKKLGIPVLVDPKGRDYSKYHGATGITPNRRETSDACGGIPDIHALLEAAETLRKNLSFEFIAVTRSEEGITLLENERQLHVPAMAKQVFDVSGAGDTVIATLAASIVAGLSLDNALHLANVAAGIVVGQVGTIAITGKALLAELANENLHEQADKVCELPQLLPRVTQWREAGDRIVFTNGCFDLLHAGHVTYLEAARKLGQRLIVGLNTDRSVSALKGPSRPVIHENDRGRVMAALAAVDAVILFDEDTPLNLIQQIHPDVLVKGDDYTEDRVVGGKEVKAWGGKVALVPLVPGRSTSNIVGKLANG